MSSRATPSSVPVAAASDVRAVAAKAMRELIEENIPALRPSAREPVQQALDQFEAGHKPLRASEVSLEAGKLTISYDGAFGPIDKTAAEAILQLLKMRGLGTRSIDFLDSVTNQIVNLVCVDGSINMTEFNSALAIIEASQPSNELEAMLVLQMIAANGAVMRSARMLAKANTTDSLAGLGNLMNKTMRTYTAQLEALAKYRRGGEQVVRHVHVNEGGQAVIANTVTTGAAR